MTIEKRLDGMERKLRRVQQRNRGLTGAILILFGGWAAAGVIRTTATHAQAQGSGTINEIRAKSIVIEDENGRVCAALGAYKDGSAIRLIDENNQTRFAAGKLTVPSPDGKTSEYPESSLALYGPDGRVIWSALK